MCDHTLRIPKASGTSFSIEISCAIKCVLRSAMIEQQWRREKKID